MTVCRFEQGSARREITPVDNQFIADYLPKAPGLYVQVYLYGLMQCYHPALAEQSAAQAAGRLESKRIMKNAAYAQLFEIMFKFALAYSDEPRPVSYKNFRGETEYQEFNRYDFLERDADGQWYWNDQFLFSCDTSAPLEGNREAMWQETRLNLQTGAFGDPAATETLVLFWAKMEELHYPGAGSTKRFLEEKLKRENPMQQAQPMGAAAQQLSAAVGG